MTTEAEALREKIVRAIADAQNVPFVGAKQKRIADAVLAVIAATGRTPDTAVVEAAARAAWDGYVADLYAESHRKPKHDISWEGLEEKNRVGWRKVARTVLETAAVLVGSRHPEPEWEYGLLNPTSEAGEYGRDDRAHLVSRNREHIERQHRRGHPSIQFVRRRPAGPWEPVSEERTET